MRRIVIQLFPDGQIQVDVQGIKGKKCTDYIRVLEEILEAESVDSAYKPEYFQLEELPMHNVEELRLKGER
ncbi:MAG TPA: DUF2997 domain-containing protein [Thermomicrobiales bacterium]|jgi:hypothetical protein